MGKHSKTNRVIDLYMRLCAGTVIRKEEEARRFGVDERSVQRDIDDIRGYLANQSVIDGSRRSVVYDRQKKGFRLTGCLSPVMTNSEILAVSKILLDSRAFTKEEMSRILEKMISGCVPYQNMKIVSELLANEKYHYVELTHPASVQEKLWELGSSIPGHRLLEISYQKQDASQPPVERVVAPAGIQFSEFYFYLHAYITEPDGRGNLRPKYDFPTVFRIDRILSYRVLPDKISLPYASRFQEGEFRKRVQFMYAGGLQQIRFRYTGYRLDAILDRLPTAVLREESEDGCIVEAEVYGRGILMWLLSQGTAVEVLSPPELRKEIREMIQKMAERYQEDG